MVHNHVSTLSHMYAYYSVFHLYFCLTRPPSSSNTCLIACDLSSFLLLPTILSLLFSNPPSLFYPSLSAVMTTVLPVSRPATRPCLAGSTSVLLPAISVRQRPVVFFSCTGVNSLNKRTNCYVHSITIWHCLFVFKDLVELPRQPRPWPDHFYRQILK